MDKIELQALLKEACVPNELYNLFEDGRDDERFCLIKKENNWEVYFSERGIKTTDKTFNTESEACQYIYDQLIE